MPSRIITINIQVAGVLKCKCLLPSLTFLEMVCAFSSFIALKSSVLMSACARANGGFNVELPMQNSRQAARSPTGIPGLQGYIVAITTGRLS